MKSRVHYVTLRLVFDKPCYGEHAVMSARNEISGHFYPTAYTDEQPGQFDVRGVKIARPPSK
jgi:hypothetical protein